MTDIETIYPAAYHALRVQLPIDWLDLDNELMKMPQLVQDAAELAAGAMNEESAAQLALDVVKAETARTMREQQEKITEAAIERNLPLYEEIQDARIAFNHAKTYAKLCEDLVRALRTKSTLLQKASEMIVAGYITPAAAYERQRDAINTARRGG